MFNKIIIILFAFSLSLFMNNTYGQIKVSPEMKDFLSMLKGTSTDVYIALIKYGGSDEIKDNEIAHYNLRSPKVLDRNNNYYSVEIIAGFTTRKYSIFWSNKKIVKIVDYGIVKYNDFVYYIEDSLRYTPNTKNPDKYFYISKEMGNFINMIKGTPENVYYALLAYGATDRVQENTMSNYSLDNPKIQYKRSNFYSVEFESGRNLRMYNIYWNEGEISKIQYKGIKYIAQR